jgi:hypothetical protein
VDFKNYQKSSVIVPELVAITHFQKAFEGNGIDHMNINLVSFWSLFYGQQTNWGFSMVEHGFETK